MSSAVAKAWEDEGFKRELINSPIEAINKLTDKKFGLRESVKMAVIDQTDSSTFYLNIPAKPDLEDMELNEEQLELVAGGGDDLENAKNFVKASLYISSFGLINLF